MSELRIIGSGPDASTPTLSGQIGCQQRGKGHDEEKNKGREDASPPHTPRRRPRAVCRGPARSAALRGGPRRSDLHLGPSLRRSPTWHADEAGVHVHAGGSELLVHGASVPVGKQSSAKSRGSTERRDGSQAEPTSSRPSAAVCWGSVQKTEAAKTSQAGSRRRGSAPPLATSHRTKRGKPRAPRLGGSNEQGHLLFMSSGASTLFALRRRRFCDTTAKVKSASTADISQGAALVLHSLWLLCLGSAEGGRGLHVPPGAAGAPAFNRVLVLTHTPELDRKRRRHGEA